MLSNGRAAERAAQRLLIDHMCLKRGEALLITADTTTDRAAAQLIFQAALDIGAKPSITLMRPVPFQGALADPYLPESIGAAARKANVWIDMCFPYLAGSHMHDESVREGGVRFLVAGGLDVPGIVRIYGTSMDDLYEIQSSFDALMIDSLGKDCQITTPKGTDVRFVLGKPGYGKPRRVDKPGSTTPPGSAVFFPELETVKGTVVLESVFHEYYQPLAAPMVLEIDGRVQRVTGGGGERRVMERSLRRAGSGDYGYVIHFTHGFHPACRNGHSLLEDIRVFGSDAVGLGLPWWQPGGGENHPDGVVTMQTVAIDGRVVVKNGAWLGTRPAARSRKAASKARPAVRAKPKKRKLARVR